MSSRQERFAQPIDDVRDIALHGIRAQVSGGAPRFVLRDVENIVIDHSLMKKETRRSIP